MTTSQQKDAPSCTSHPQDEGPDSLPDKLTSVYHYCGYALNITRDFGAGIGVASAVWEAARFLCQYFESMKITFTGKKVIELGSGTGLVGILAVLLGGDVTLTDLPLVLNQIKDNVSANIPPAELHRTKVHALLWGEDQKFFPNDYDIILGSDIVYLECGYPSLIQTLQDLSNENTVIYLSSNIMHELGVDRFYNDLITQYFDCEVVSRSSDKYINVFKITKRCPDPGDKNKESKA
ncbi:EEF1A lysine methyltransferase 3-like [Callorhinchus milii]|uniref:EEF1A lysine methyltransferase 3-like n=1 Tax=Callorhinchus milii TaxID=7868 RepID=UPI0004574CD8|nr:EEF1A lysine methyltransferase 3-like [Callorhinchus milii]|eukprot:gi/632977297/ref/XP_007905268.1/ PREDICTED: protein-lysine methyltransferase METTL21B-like [Callorhinchus milii]